MDKSKFKKGKDLCPICKVNFLYEENVLNPLSKKGKGYICDDCSKKEDQEILKGE